MGFIEEAPMQTWQITFVDDHGQSVEQFACEQMPSLEDAAHDRNKLLPVAAELDLNDLEGPPSLRSRSSKTRTAFKSSTSPANLNIPVILKRLWWRSILGLLCKRDQRMNR
jgi:hypothetical protein